MTPALTPAGRSYGTHPSHEPRTRREHLEPAYPFTPVTALGTDRKMRVERRAGHLRRQFLAVGTGGYSGTNVTAVHPAIVPGTGPAASTGGRRA